MSRKQHRTDRVFFFFWHFLSFSRASILRVSSLSLPLINFRNYRYHFRRYDNIHMLLLRTYIYPIHRNHKYTRQTSKTFTRDKHVTVIWQFRRCMWASHCNIWSFGSFRSSKYSLLPKTKWQMTPMPRIQIIAGHLPLTQSTTGRLCTVPVTIWVHGKSTRVLPWIWCATEVLFLLHHF